MSNIGEEQITRLTRERLAAIKKFLPVRDSFRDNLQAQQQAKMDFTTDTQQLFKPIIETTEKVVTAIKESRPEVTPQVTPQLKPPIKNDTRLQELRNRFTEETLATIEKSSGKDLMELAAYGYPYKEKYLKPGQKGYIKNVDEFAKAVYKIKNNLAQADNTDPIYSTFMATVRDYITEGQLIKAEQQKKNSSN